MRCWQSFPSRVITLYNLGGVHVVEKNSDQVFGNSSESQILCCLIAQILRDLLINFEKIQSMPWKRSSLIEFNIRKGV